MAISQLNVGAVPTGVGGDSLRSAAAKINENFKNNSHAASRLVGKEAGNVLEMVGNVGIGGFGLGATSNLDQITATTVDELRTSMNTKGTGFYRYNVSALGESSPTLDASSPTMFMRYGTIFTTFHASYRGMGIKTAVGSTSSGGSYLIYTLYTDKNTTKDANGFLKGASPIVKVHADKVVLNDEAEQQNVTFKKNGIGDYTIITESGLSTDGWYIELPKDLNGNPKVAVTLSEVDGVISLKSYKRIFSMETFTFEPDLDNPLDIPDTRWIDLRLNEIPAEDEEDIQTDV